MEYSVRTEALGRRFGNTEALSGLDLEVPAGTVLGLLGHNGAGKTTAVRILTTLAQPTTGSARVAGHDVVAEPAAVRRRIGLAGQSATVDGLLTARANLEMVGRLYHLPAGVARARAAELLERLGLTDAADRLVRTFSGGMRRRLDLAASLVGRPSVIFLDEPTTGLDPSKREDMWGVVRSLVNDGSTVLLTTQYLDEADALADEITVIDHGKVIAHDTPSGLKRVVGGQRLTVRPADPSRLGEVSAIIGELAGAAPEPSGRGVISVPVSGDEVLGDAVYRLSAADIAVTELSLHLPSLDEVFFTLTGRTTEALVTA